MIDLDACFAAFDTEASANRRSPRSRRSCWRMSRRSPSRISTCCSGAPSTLHLTRSSESWSHSRRGGYCFEQMVSCSWCSSRWGSTFAH